MTASAKPQPAVQTAGLHHLGLTVPDVESAANFFCQVLNFSTVGENPAYPAKFVSDGTIMLTLWQVKSPVAFTAFDRHHNVGLHHFALKVANGESLQQLHTRLQTVPGVCVEFAPEPLRGTPIQHMMCTIPGGLRVEFITAA